jgi:hypothetical protein
MLRRCSRLQRSQVHVSRPFSTPRAQVIAARAASGAVVPQVAQTGGRTSPVPGCSESDTVVGYFVDFAGRAAAFVTVAALALAAALAACLNSRTLVSDVASTTSATER